MSASLRLICARIREAHGPDRRRGGGPSISHIFRISDRLVLPFLFSLLDVCRLCVA